MSYSKERLKYLKKRKKEKIFVFSMQILLFIAFIFLWELFARLKIINTFLTSSPSKIITTLVNLSTVWKTGKFKTRTGDTPANADLIKELLKLKKIHTIHPHWVKGHAKADKGGNVYNHRCDELAYAAMCKIANENGVKKDIKNRKDFK